MSDLPAVKRIAREALEDMRSNNVRYAELRTTPRPLADGTSRRDYVVNVLRVFREFEGSQATNSLGAEGGEPLPAGRLIPRLLVSVDRSKSTREAMDVAELAVELRANEEWRPFVVGMDFSGNPTKGSFKDFRCSSKYRQTQASSVVRRLTFAVCPCPPCRSAPNEGVNAALPFPGVPLQSCKKVLLKKNC